LRSLLSLFCFHVQKELHAHTPPALRACLLV